MKGKFYCGLMALMLTPAFSIFCAAADIVTAQSGSWTSTSTWVGGTVPAQADNVTVKAGHTVTIPSSGTKSCTNLIVETGGKLYANTSGSQRYVDIYGNILCEGTIGNGSLNDGISFNIEGASCLISGSGCFDASRIRKNTGSSQTTALTIGTDISLRYGGTALFNNKSASVFHVIIAPSCTLNITGSSGVSGNACIDGTNASNGSSYGGSITVNGTMNVSGILYLTTDNNSTAYSVSFTINSGGVVNTSSAVCINSGSAFHYTSICDGGKLNFTSGDWGTIGSTYNSYTFGTASTVEFSSATAQTIGMPAAYGNLIASGTGEKTLTASNVIVNGDLTIQQGSSLSVPQSGSLTLNGSLFLHTVDGLILKSGSLSSPPGSFIHNGAVSGSGTIRVERFIPAYVSQNDANFHQISSPVLSQSIQPEFVAEPPESLSDFYRWDEAQGLWVNSKTASGLWNTSFQPMDDRHFRQGTGYLAAYPTDAVKNFSGAITGSDLDIPVTYTSGSYSGYNLIGNPYPCSLTANIHEWIKTGVDNAVWVWDAVIGNYRTWNGITGTLNGGIIPAMQGFFVKASSFSPALVIPAASRTHGAFAALKSALPMTLTVTLEGETYKDISVLFFAKPLAGLPDSVFNLSKMKGFQDAPQLWFISPKAALSVLLGNSQDSVRVFPLGIARGGSDTLRFVFSGLETFQPNDVLFLEDRMEGRMMDLREFPVYSFISSHEKEEGRFFLHYRNTTSAETHHIPAKVKLSHSQGFLKIEGLDDFMGFELLKVYDMAGRKVTDRIIPPGTPKVRLNLDPAWYLVRLDYGRSTVTTKVLILK